nr:hypothetical protein [Sphingobacterium mizutaii]
MKTTYGSRHTLWCAMQSGSFKNSSGTVPIGKRILILAQATIG